MQQLSKNYLASRLRSVESEFSKKQGELGLLKKKFSAQQERKEQLVQRESLVLKTAELLKSVSDTSRAAVVDGVASVVTRALQAVKGPDLEFRLALGVERGVPDLKMRLYDAKTDQSYDIIDSCGGGIADIVAFALRASLLYKLDNSLPKVMVLDEQFKYVGVKDQPALAEFVRYVAETLCVQIILVTHSSALSENAHKVFEVQKEGATSIVKEI